MLSFALTSFPTQPQPFFVFLQFGAGSDNITLELSKGVLLSETKLNYVNNKATRVYSFTKMASFLFEEKILKFSLLNQYLLVFSSFFKLKIRMNLREFLSINFYLKIKV